MTDLNMIDEVVPSDNLEKLDPRNNIIFLPDDFLALVGKHNGRCPPNFLSATKTSSNISISTGHSDFGLSESSQFSSTLVGEGEAQHIHKELAEPELVEVEHPKCSPDQHAPKKQNEEECVEDIHESLSIIWQISQFLAVWMAAFIAALITALQLMQTALAEENKLVKSALSVGEKLKTRENRES